MTGLLPDTHAVRCHLLIVGVANYKLGWGEIRDGVEAEVAKAESLFLDLLKFERSTFARISDTTQHGILEGISNWLDGVPATPGDLVVVYYTGHGMVDRSIFYLITSEVPSAGRAALLSPCRRPHLFLKSGGATATSC